MAKKSASGKHRECVKFGQRVKQLREDLGLTQMELSHKARMHQTYLAGIESGARNPTLRIILSLAKKLKVSPSELMEVFD